MFSKVGEEVTSYGGGQIGSLCLRQYLPGEKQKRNVELIEEW